jgi:hypothetical protein
MTNKDRALKSTNQQVNESTGRTPWASPRELRQFWAIANEVFEKKQAVERVHDAIQFQFHVEKMHELTREEFLKLMGDWAKKIAANRGNVLDSYFAGQAMEPSWRRIRWLQRQLAWTDAHLVNYILALTHIDNVRWLSVNRAHAVISGMSKSLTLRERRRT